MCVYASKLPFHAAKRSFINCVDMHDQLLISISSSCTLKDGNGIYPSGIAGTFCSPLRRIHPVPVPVNCLGYKFLPIPVPIGYRSGNRYPTGTAYPINKDTWVVALQSETFLLHPDISVGVSEMPRRRSEVARRTSEGDRETELRKRGARALVRQTCLCCWWRW